MTNALPPSLTLADRQALHRAKKEAEGFQRITTYLSPAASAALARVVTETSMSRQDAIQFLLNQGSTMYDELTPEIALKNAPNEKARAAMRQRFIASGAIKDGLTPQEQVELDAFKNNVAGDQVEARRVMIAGGEKAIEQKSRVSESWLSGNVHTQGNQK